ISANDSSGFTFRGRFNKSYEAVSVSYEVSQKAHNALKWLINRQAKIVDGRVFLAWSNNRLDIPDSQEDSFDLYTIANVINDKEEKFIPDTGEKSAEVISKAISGYKARFDQVDKHVIVLNLDAATTGRLAVVYYRNMELNYYLDNLQRWHTTCRWLHSYRKNNEGKFVSFYGAPSPRDIAYTAYGSKVNDKVVKEVIVLKLDAATTGRLAVVYYRNMELNYYLDNLQRWHTTCRWLHSYRKNNEGKFVSFYGAPSPRDIAYTAYGSKVNDKVVKEVMDRMIPW